MTCMTLETGTVTCSTRSLTSLSWWLISLRFDFCRSTFRSLWKQWHNQCAAFLTKPENLTFFSEKQNMRLQEKTVLVMRKGHNLRLEVGHTRKAFIAYCNNRSLVLSIKSRSTRKNSCADWQARIRVCNTIHVCRFW